MYTSNRHDGTHLNTVQIAHPFIEEWMRDMTGEEVKVILALSYLTYNARWDCAATLGEVSEITGLTLETCALIAVKFEESIVEIIEVSPEVYVRLRVVGRPSSEPVRHHGPYTSKKKEKVLVPGRIYVVYNPIQGIYKIGKSKQYESRLKDLPTLNPDAEILFTVEVQDYDGFEKSLHQNFRDKHYKLEWFKLEDEDLDTIKVLAKQWNKKHTIPKA